MRGAARSASARALAMAAVAALAAVAGWTPGAAAGAVAPTGADAASSDERIIGRVDAGGAPLVGADVTLYAANARGPATVLATTRTGSGGAFRLSHEPSGATHPVRYLLTRGGRTAAGERPASFTLAAVLDPAAPPRRVVVNEITTVGSAFSTAQFVRGRDIAGPAPGMPRAAAMVGHLADVRTGRLGVSALAYATPQRVTPKTIRSLANMLAACTTDARACGRLIDLARPAGRPRPADTFEAMAMIADTPTNSVDGLFGLADSGPRPFRPALAAAPTAWTVALRLLGPTFRHADGRVISRELNGPGLVAFDADGDAWISNNYEWNPDPLAPVCAGKAVFELDPTVTGRRVLTDSLVGFRADQLWGAGFGIAVDPRDRVWVGNFGFQGGGPLRPDASCTEPPQPPPDVSVSLFGPNGAPLSPAVARNPPSGGFTAGDFVGPQGMLTDRDGSLWIAGCGNRRVVRYPDGRPDRAVSIAADGLQQPFGLWLDGGGNAWVTSNQTGQVFAFAPDGTQLPGSPFGDVDTLNRSMGIVVDSAGNKWISNSFWVNAPCGDWKANALADLEPGGSVTLLQTDAPGPRLTKFTAPSLSNPWGIAVDGDDNVFVANFGGQRLAEFCGVRTSTCPAGHTTGQAIGDDGYPYAGLTRNTGVSIDPSGHVWLANNWLQVPIQSNPGGHGVVVYFGLAEPIQTPVHGPPVPVLDRRTGDAVSLTARQLRINQRIGQAAIRRLAIVEARLDGREPPVSASAGSTRPVTLSVRQLRINQRISQAAIRRAAALDARIDGASPPATERSEGGGIALSVEQLLINQRIAQAAVRRANALEERVA